MYNEIISTIGLPQEVIQKLIIAGVVAIAVGYILVTGWKYILFGCVGLFCLMVFANQDDTVKPLNGPPIVEQKTTEEKYYDECSSLTGNRLQCEELIKERL